MHETYNPFLVALDTYVLADISKDFMTKDKRKRLRAKKLIRVLSRNFCIPIITHHHIEELVAHHNVDIVERAINLIEYIPLVATIVPTGGTFPSGSIIDIDTYEIEQITKGAKNYEEVVCRVRKKLYNICSGQELISSYTPMLNAIRQHALSRENRKKEIVSISISKSFLPENTKLSELDNATLRPPEAAKKLLKAKQKELAEEIEIKGDKKLQNPHGTASEFMSSVLESGMNMYEQEGTTKEKFLAQFGISPDEVKDLTTLDQLQNYAIFKERIKIICRNQHPRERKQIKEVKEIECPSWQLWKELYRIRIKAARACGSDINDGFLACLVPYADLTIVDKRTNEYLQQIKRKRTDLAKLMGQFAKLKHYNHLLEHCPINKTV